MSLISVSAELVDARAEIVLLQLDIYELKQELTVLRILEKDYGLRILKISEENEQLKSDNAALVECVKWYASYWNHEIQLEDSHITRMQHDMGQIARECLSKLGGGNQ
ncbi:hypothetical protein [Paenibacillus sp. OV219]|uniref:hypothetical protein n=1 Tax=Paenibacillus sp. OV219 TaxID=1884377 RepID=UPI0008BC362F|nr:hypothetical protein [Paenibacillus sp. OV219]SEN21270.1 hypothetical protein SAMN05518847_102426 [Paenibacillus sp. OV219]